MQNTPADPILEVTIPEVDIAPGEGLELGVSSEQTYVDGPASGALLELPCVQSPGSCAQRINAKHPSEALRFKGVLLYSLDYLSSLADGGVSAPPIG